MSNTDFRTKDNYDSLIFQMRISYDDQFLFTVGMDGSLFAFNVTDKEGRGLKREKDITYSEEVLVARSDLDEKVREWACCNGASLIFVKPIASCAQIGSADSM